MVFRETETCYFFSGIYPWSLPILLAFDGCRQKILNQDRKA